MGAVYSQLSITERRRIERWRHAKVPVDEMARVLKRCRSTIFRELKRNHFSDESLPKCDGYYGDAAQLKMANRRARQRKLIKHPDLCRRVVERIKNGWTPEQIGNRMIHECARPRVCQETIYRYIYSKEGQRDDLWWYLPTHRVARRPRRTRRRREPKFHRDVSILFRPDDVAHRRQFGHWEGDLMIFARKEGSKSNVTSLIERKSRYTVLAKNDNRKPDAVAKNVIGQIYARFEAAGLTILGAKMKQLSKADAEGFYAVHSERPFFNDLVSFMTSGPVMIQVLEVIGCSNLSLNSEIA